MYHTEPTSVSSPPFCEFELYVVSGTVQYVVVERRTVSSTVSARALADHPRRDQLGIDLNTLDTTLYYSSTPCIQVTPSARETERGRSLDGREGATVGFVVQPPTISFFSRRQNPRESG